MDTPRLSKMDNDILPPGKTLCVGCGDMWPIEDTCKLDGLCFYCCTHDKPADGPRPTPTVQ
jgi:hypothetical protein